MVNLSPRKQTHKNSKLLSVNQQTEYIDTRANTILGIVFQASDLRSLTVTVKSEAEQGPFHPAAKQGSHASTVPLCYSYVHMNDTLFCVASTRTTLHPILNAQRILITITSEFIEPNKKYRSLDCGRDREVCTCDNVCTVNVPGYRFIVASLVTVIRVPQDIGHRNVTNIIFKRPNNCFRLKFMCYLEPKFQPVD